MPRLVLTRDDKTQEYELLEETTLGRSSRNTIRVPEGKASRQHARIIKQGSQYVIEDLGSSNGTYVNNIKIKSQPLNAGDEIRIGKTKFEYVEVIDDPLVGATLGNYRIEERLGKGGMGSVYRAKQITMDRDVALKVMRSEFARNHNFIKDFMREARTAGRLHHPNIIGIHDFGEERGHYFFSMEYVRGETLADRVERSGPMPAIEAIDVIISIVEGLKHAHDQEIIHQDIKPENIMIADSGMVKIADLGLAKSMSYNVVADDKPVMGTPQYVAPEIVRRMPPDPRSDIYSLGATIFFMVTGHPPYEGDKPTTVVRKHLDAPVPDPRDKRRDLPAELAEFIMKSMAKDAARRHADCASMLETLRSMKLRLSEGKAPPKQSARAAAREPAVPLLPPAGEEAPAPSAPGVSSRHKTEALPVRNPWTPVAVGIMLAASILVAGVISLGIYVLIKGGGGESEPERMLREAREHVATHDLSRAEEILSELQMMHPDSAAAMQAGSVLAEVRQMRRQGLDDGRQEFDGIRQRWKLNMLTPQQTRDRLRSLLNKEGTSAEVRQECETLLQEVDRREDEAAPDDASGSSGSDTQADEARAAWEEVLPVVDRRVGEGELAIARDLLQGFLERHDASPVAEQARSKLRLVEDRIRNLGKTDVETARSARAAGRLAEAVASLERVLRNHPESPWAEKADAMLVEMHTDMRGRYFAVWDKVRERMTTLDVDPVRAEAAALVESMQGLPWEQPARDLANAVEALRAARRAMAATVRADSPEVGAAGIGAGKATVQDDRLHVGGQAVGWDALWLDDILILLPPDKANDLERLGVALYCSARGHEGYARTYLEKVTADGEVGRFADSVFAMRSNRAVIERFDFARPDEAVRWRLLAGAWSFRDGRLSAQGGEMAQIELADRAFRFSDIAVAFRAVSKNGDGQTAVVLGVDETHFLALRRTGDTLVIEYADGRLPPARAETGVRRNDAPLRLEVRDGEAMAAQGFQSLATLPAPAAAQWRGRLRLEFSGTDGYFDEISVAEGR